MTTFLVLWLIVGVYSDCSQNSIICSDCSTCRSDSVQNAFAGTNVWGRASIANVTEFMCAPDTGVTARGCFVFVNDSSQIGAVAGICNARSSGNCCFESSWPILGGAISTSNVSKSICQRRTCAREALGCRVIGACAYDETSGPVTEGCCQVPEDCPPVIFGGTSNATYQYVNDTAFNRACGARTCRSGNCRFDPIPMCCLTTSDCLLSAPVPPFGGASFRCIADPLFASSVPQRGTCVLGFYNDTTCNDDFDCGGNGLANQCVNGDCVSGQCNMTPRNVGSVQGCCTESNTVPCATSDLCLIPDTANECNGLATSVPLFSGGFDTLLPDHRCNYESKRPEGCCTSNADCFTLSNGRECVSSVCDLATNRCQVKLDTPGLLCAERSAECPFPDRTNMCLFGQVVNPAYGRGPDRLLFRCTPREIPGCPANATLEGLAPDPSLLFMTPNCTFSCSNVDERNSVRIALSISNSIDLPPRPLYFYTVRIIVFHDGLTTSIHNITLLNVDDARSPFYEHYNIRVRDGNDLYQSALNDPVVAGSLYSRTFQPIGLNTLSVISENGVGDSEVLHFNIRYGNVLTPPSLTLIAEVDVYDICVPYYYGQTGCSGPIDDNQRLFRNRTSTPPLVITLASTCSPTCSAVPTPPPSPVSPSPGPTPIPTSVPPGSPTPSPTGGPTPTTPSPTVPSSVQPTLPARLSSQPLFASPTLNVTFHMRDCTWQCGDVFDGTINRVLFEVNQVCGSLNPCRPAKSVTFSSVSVAGTDAGLVAFELGVSDNVHMPNYGFQSSPAYTVASVLNPTTTSKFINSVLTVFPPTATGAPLVYFPELFFHPLDPARDFSSMDVTVAIGFGTFTCTADDVTALLCSSGDVGNLVAPLFSSTMTIPWLSLGCSRPCDAPPINSMIPPAIEEATVTNCQVGCDSPRPNVLQIDHCRQVDSSFVIGPGVSRVPLRQLYYNVGVKIGSSFEGLPMRVYQNGTLLVPQVVFVGNVIGTTIFTTFVMNQPAILASTSDSICVHIEFDINPQTFDPIDLITTSGSAISNTRCSIIDTFSGGCLPNLDNLFPEMASLSAYESIVVFENQFGSDISTRAFINLPGNSGGVTTLLGARVFSTLSAPCESVCVRVPILNGTVGGLVFFDSNGDGDFDELGDSPMPNIRVRALTTGNSISSVLLATTLTNPTGVYFFNRSYLFSAEAGNPSGRNVIFRIATPERYVPSPLGISPEVEFNNRFTPENVNGTVVITSFVITNSTPSVAISAGFQDRSTSCSPPSGPLPNSQQLILTSEQSDSDSCQEFPFSDPCAELCQTIPTATYRRVLLKYGLHNNATSANERGTVVADLSPLYGMVHCLEPSIYQADPALRLLEARRPKLRAPYNKPATASYAFPRMPAGQVLEFSVLWSMCFVEDIVPAYNSSLYIFSDRCVRRVRERRNCVQPNIDISDCVSNIAGDLTGYDVGCEIPDLGDNPRPRNSSAPLTLTADTDIAREQASCITHSRIDSFRCPETQVVYDKCAESGTNRTAVVAFARVSANETSEAGSFTITLTRKMSAETLVCGLLFDPQVQILLRNGSGVFVENTRARVINSRVDADRVAVIDVAFSSLEADETIEVVLRQLECGGAELLDYKIEVEIRTDPCIGADQCRSQALYKGRVNLLHTLPDCLTLGQMANQTFIHQNSPGPRAHEAHEEVKVVSLGQGGFWVVVVMLVLTFLCCFVLVICYVRNRYRRRLRPVAKRAKSRI